MLKYRFLFIYPSWDSCTSLVAQSVKNLPCKAGDPGSISVLGRCPGKGNGNPLQYSCLENPIYRGAWQTTVHGVTRVGHNLATKPPLPRFVTAILPRSTSLGFPGGSAGKESTRSAGDLGSISGVGKILWKRERLPTPVFRPGEFHGLYSPWGLKKSNTTKRLSISLFQFSHSVISDSW